MKQAMALALLASPLAPSSTAFLAMTPTRSLQHRVTQQNQHELTSARERCGKRRVHTTPLYGKSTTGEDPEPRAVWAMPSLFMNDGREQATESAMYDEQKHDSPAGMLLSVSLIEVATVAAVALTIINYLGPLDSASAAVATSTGVELVAQAGSVPVDVGAIFAKVSEPPW